MTEPALDGAFDAFKFPPWVGKNYHSRENRFRLRVLVIGESHYLREGEEKEHTTIGVVRWFTQRAETKEGKRHPFFTKIAKVLRGERQWIDDRELAQVFQEIAFYNFVQSFVRDGPRGQPTFRQWVEAQAPLKTVLEVLRPDAALVLGPRLCDHILDWPDNTEREVIAHPSGRGFSYDKPVSQFKALVQRAQART